MGIGSWFGFGSRPERAEIAPAASRVPTSQDLLDAIDRVEQQAREGKAPGMVQSRLGRVARIVRDTVPRLETLGHGAKLVDLIGGLNHAAQRIHARGQQHKAQS